MSQYAQQPPQVDIANTTSVVCESCGNDTFKDIMYIRKESRFTSGLPVDRMVPIQLIVCDKCGELVEDFIQAPLKQFYGKSAENIQSL